MADLQLTCSIQPCSCHPVHSLMYPSITSNLTSSTPGPEHVWCEQIASELQEASLSQNQVELCLGLYHEAQGQLDSQRRDSSEASHAPGLALSTVGRLLTVLHLMYPVRSHYTPSAT